jgi:hypothetical protein
MKFPHAFAKGKKQAERRRSCDSRTISGRAETKGAGSAAKCKRADLEIGVQRSNPQLNDRWKAVNVRGLAAQVSKNGCRRSRTDATTLACRLKSSKSSEEGSE